MATYWMSGPSSRFLSPVEPDVRVALPVAGSTWPLNPLTSWVLLDERAAEESSVTATPPKLLDSPLRYGRRRATSPSRPARAASTSARLLAAFLVAHPQRQHQRDDSDQAEHQAVAARGVRHAQAPARIRWLDHEGYLRPGLHRAPTPPPGRVDRSTSSLIRTMLASGSTTCAAARRRVADAKPMHRARVEASAFLQVGEGARCVANPLRSMVASGSTRGRTKRLAPSR